MLTALALAVVVGKIASTAVHEPHARGEIDLREATAAAAEPVMIPPDSVETAANAAAGQPLQSPACLPREAHPHAH